MFQSLTSILTMSAMLLHSILGCCTHHAHACEHGHVVEGCVAGHDEHESEHVEQSHEEHGHDHQHGEKSEHEHDGVAVAHEDGHGDHESQECPHGPCGFDCEGGDCTFTQPSKVKTPNPADSGLCFPVAITHEFVSSVTGLVLKDRSDSGPPRALSACCCRTMVQVWLI